jgi:signal transduction histidine kinase
VDGNRSSYEYRYYQPKNLSDLPTISPILERDFTNHILPNADNFTTQQSFSDTALTAFTQLIALRLASQRAIVSLIDHENEYFLAESTSTLSLIDDEGPAQNAWLSISGARVPREKSLCEQTLRLVPNQDTTAEMTPWFLVPDLRLDEKMSKLDCVKGPPYLRFYCGVALTNKKGINIGCVYVVDDRARTDFSLEQAQFLTKMAATVMDHLENIRAKEDIVRVTMMSQALHAFIEGDGTMNGDWQRLKRYNLPAGAGVGFHWESNKNDGAGSYINGKKELGSPENWLSPDMDANHGQSPLQHTGTNLDARYNFNNSPWSSSEEVPQVPLKSVFQGVEDAAAALTGGRDTEFINGGFSNLLHTTFSRASNLVREGMEVDGAVFFDAPFRFYQGRSTLETDPRRSGNQASETSDESDDDEHLDTRPGPRPHVMPAGHPHSRPSSRVDSSDPRAAPSIATSMGLKSEILGYSTLNSSSWNNQTSSQITNFTAIDQSLLTSLVRRYPQGELFVFDQDGPISPPPELTADDGSQATITPAADEKQVRHRARKRAEILRLLIAFPGARQIFFVPLYDSTSGCFIGSFAWSTSATRIFSIDNHLSYLIAFGHSVMSEVSRLNTLSADNAKGDFISNVSHELRSPLHGILASVEFLADTSLDGFQRNLVDTVDICGRTLLDTIEHVLDFSKIKKFGQETVQPMGVVSDLDISAVIEEVLEGVHAGFEFNGLSSQGLADTTMSQRAVPSSPKERDIPDGLQFGVTNDLLTVIIDIDFRDSWKFPTVPGTWRRLTMNIFGNALKYTHAGYIRIKLEARALPSVLSAVDNTPVERTMVTLTISDTGRGMSSDFLKTKVFMPFSQV